MLKNLFLENFRNHKKLSLNLSPVTVFIGKNGAGKTNILESLGLLSFCRSFREENKKNLINISSSYCRIVCDDLLLLISKEPRLSLKARKSDVPKKLAEFVGLLPAVVISPESIAIVSGSPGERRRFLDIMISQEDKEYLLAISKFKKIRYQRNSLLSRINEGISSISELDFWNNEFIGASELISKRRGEAISFLNKTVPSIYQKISGNAKDQIKIRYEKNYEGSLKRVLELNQAKEIASKGSLFGPHRDDLIFTLNELSMSNFASRGELKSAVLSLKIAELEFIQEKAAKRAKLENILEPILLLDDIFSEFDADRKDHLVQLIANYQTFITVTGKDSLPPNIAKNATIISV